MKDICPMLVLTQPIRLMFFNHKFYPLNPPSDRPSRPPLRSGPADAGLTSFQCLAPPPDSRTTPILQLSLLTFYLSLPSPAVRNPIRSSMVYGESPTTRRVSCPSSLIKFPPRTTGDPLPSSLAVHSETLPARSRTP